VKVFVDTNIFIDILLDREPFSADAIRIYKLCEQGLIDGYIAPITVNNIYYICRKAKNLESIKAYLADISRFFTIAPMNSECIIKANTLRMNDYEDALQYAMAMQMTCEYLVTRNVKDFKHIQHLKVVTPETFIKF
jgi:predicted nucleic acid-binding protein